ncbi:MAG: M48 family metalloprotease [Chloroflexi bacterium]|nr:M48 family metalloprotease [Chloroflexota bacterium]
MTTRHLRPGMVVAALGGAVVAVCLAIAPTQGRDPILAVELAGLAILSIWTGIGLRETLRGRRLAHALDHRSAPDEPTGVPCRVVREGGRHAFVLGAIRPNIYVGDELLRTLDTDELRAVLLHEEHHRRTLAPLRAIALEAWLTLAGRSALARAALLDRLTDLEVEADAAALRWGADPSALASALLKIDVSLTAGASFAAAPAERLRTLVALAAGDERVGGPRLPYEWLPVAAAAIVALACHLSGLSALR